MPSRFVLVGCGGIGSQLLAPLVRYLVHSSREALLVLVDGDVFEPGNALRQEFPASAVGPNKAEALAGWVREAGLACQAVPLYLDEGERRRGHSRRRRGPARGRQPSNASAHRSPHRRLAEATLISGGNSESTATSSSSAGATASLDGSL